MSVPPSCGGIFGAAAARCSSGLIDGEGVSGGGVIDAMEDGEATSFGDAIEIPVVWDAFWEER